MDITECRGIIVFTVMCYDTDFGGHINPMYSIYFVKYGITESIKIFRLLSIGFQFVT